ncbi:MurR/RpiR family transcriptional regulator [Cetobacterium sp. 2A]|uniref:MurR/RpiR family transcriptional regulator n=1 Tax=Cetobacterium sp. 2A TaxID=2754723 RepID=UPI00163B9A01|nr:MurR/RpiR family transcriptional regulator [Cetobacterium sp. 2A]MBC2854956.1 MurR/RpiR family transcriptional regulator [Cetobacterium sp. 2A]
MEINIMNELMLKKTKSSKMFKIISSYMIENIHEIPLLNLKEVSEKSGVSTATIVRFCKSLNFSGYSELQTTLKNFLKKEIIPTKEFRESIINDRESFEVFNDIIDTNIDMLKALKTEKVFLDLEEIVNMLNTSNKVYIVGNRLSYSFAYYLFYLLKGLKEEVEMITSDREDYTNKLLYVKPDDVVFSICFYPYVKFTYKITSYFICKGCRVICLTDTMESPFVELGDKVLYAYNNSKTYSFIAAISMLNFIVTSFGKKNKNHSLEQIQKLKSITEEIDIYFKK